MTRDDSGRFIKGESGNPKGRPSKAREEKYYDILVSACTPADWKAICEKATSQAKKGDPVARKFLADYIIGPAIQRQEVTGKDGGDMKIVVRLKDIDGSD